MAPTPSCAWSTADRASVAMNANGPSSASIEDPPHGPAARRAWVGLALSQAIVVYNVTSTSLNPNAKIAITMRPSPLQDKAFKLLNVNPVCSQ